MKDSFVRDCFDILISHMFYPQYYIFLQDLKKIIIYKSNRELFCNLTDSMKTPKTGFLIKKIIRPAVVLLF